MIKIAIAGIGNCASSLIQGFHYYSNARHNEIIPGLLHPYIKGYKPGDISVVAAFDIDARKVGKDISEAIFEKPNCTKTFCEKVPAYNLRVLKGPTYDGFPPSMKNSEISSERKFIESDESPVDVTAILKETRPDMLINYLPVGSEEATRFYVKCCLEAGVSFVNAIPVFICSGEENYVEEFKERGLICVGDDIKSQVGATIIHRVLSHLFGQRGVILERTYQLNTGGNTDFLTMKDEKRIGQKRKSKTQSVQSQLERPLCAENIHIGPSDYVPWQKDNKVCFIRMEGRGFGNVPMNLELRLSVEDSPNSAGVMIDVIRCVKIGLDRGLRGYLEEISAFGFKSPKKQFSDEAAYKLVEEFINKGE